MQQHEPARSDQARVHLFESSAQMPIERGYFGGLDRFEGTAFVATDLWKVATLQGGRQEAISKNSMARIRVSGPNLQADVHQLSLVVYPVIYRVVYIPGGCLGFLSSTVFQEDSIQMDHY